MSDYVEPLPQGWKTAHMLESARGGKASTWSRRMETLRDELRKKFASQGMSEDAAADKVDRLYIGMRKNVKGPAALAASPMAQSMLPELAPLIENGWMTGSMLGHQQGGASTLWDKVIRELQLLLIQEKMEKEGLGEDEATQYVEINLIGMRRAKTGYAALAASPEALALLPERPRRLEPGWKTAYLYQKSGGGSQEHWEKKIRGLRDNLISDIAQQMNVSTEEATTMVEKNLVGLRSYRQGPPALAVSPDAQRLLPESFPSLKPGWKTGNLMMREHGGNNVTWKKRIMLSANKKTAELITEGLSEEDARHWVTEHWAAICNNQAGPHTWAASPLAQEQILLEREAATTQRR